MIASINPCNNQIISTFEAHTPTEVQTTIRQSQDALQQWKHFPIEMRAEKLRQLAQVLRLRKEEFAAIMSLEMGKVLREARAEIEKCAMTCEFYAEKAPIWLADQEVSTEARRSYVRFEPLGIVLAIMPWNFPFWQFLRFAAPALVAGNVVLLKHAPNVPQSALAIMSAMAQAGLPEGVFGNLFLPNERVHEAIENPLVQAITFTGSSAAGRKVASLAGLHLKKAVLELGGSDPFMVLADADIAFTAKQAAKARMTNTGQSCISAKRFIVEKAVVQEFTEALRHELSSLKMGNPADETNDYGAMAREDLAQTLQLQVENSVRGGAKLLLGGTRPDYSGAWFPATLLTDVQANTPAYSEEMFGPVAAIITAENTEHALQIANDTDYGLGGSVWTRDLEKGEAVARRIQAGNAFVNEIVKSDPRLPFGGIRQSGYGREMSHFGLTEFTNVKSIWIAS
jgi:succinate-semialdehyde dehydrogenase/glutarate-semialdehyde dehydrogenase